MTQWLVLIRGFMGRETSKTLIEGLKETDNHLNNMIHDFAEIAMKDQVEIRCFYETRESQGAKAVMSGVLAQVFPTVKVDSPVSSLSHPLLTLSYSLFQKNRLVLMVTSAFHWTSITE